MQGWGHTARANLWITERMDREASAGPTPTLLKAMCRPPAAFSSWIPEGDGCNSLTQGALKLQCTRNFAGMSQKSCQSLSIENNLHSS